MSVEIGLIALLMGITGALLGWILSHERRVSVLEAQHEHTVRTLESIAKSLDQLVDSVHTVEVSLAQRRSGDHRDS